MIAPGLPPETPPRAAKPPEPAPSYHLPGVKGRMRHLHARSGLQDPAPLACALAPRRKSIGWLRDLIRTAIALAAMVLVWLCKLMSLDPREAPK
jgi:hypothetical protein